MSATEGSEEIVLPEPGESWVPLLAVVVVGLVGALVFLSNPQIDLDMARLFYLGDGRFFGRDHRWVEWVRNLFVVFYFGCIALALVGLFMTRKPPTPWLGWSFPYWLFLAICLGAGPGLVANLILKDQWGRARPGHVTEFGGKKAFSPPLIPTRECPKNCSFVSGEASSMYIPFYAAAVLMPQNAVALVAAGTVFGIAAGVVRMAQGGHFLSDVIYAGIAMAITVLVTRYLMFGSPLASRLRRRLEASAAKGAKARAS